MGIRYKGKRYPVCGGCGQPWIGVPCPCGEGSLEPLMAFPSTAKHIQSVFKTLKGNATRVFPDFPSDFNSIEKMEKEMEDLFPRG